MPKQGNALADRTDRTMETRDAENRAQRYRPPEQLPEADPQPGYRHRWVALSVLGEPDIQNQFQRKADGWVPCTPQEQPRVAAMVGVKSGEVIEFGGLQLCKNTVEQVQAREDYYANLNRLQTRDAREKFRQEAKPVSEMPLIEDINSQVSRGSRFGSGE